MNILQAKTKLYNQLKSNPLVVGAGVTKIKNTDTIIIYLSKSLTIPKTFEGYNVKKEIIGKIKAL